MSEPVLYRDESGRILGHFDPDRPDLAEALAAAKAKRDLADAINAETLRRARMAFNRW